MPATLPETFGRYRILKKLGEGGMGTVYLAHDSEMDREVALKVPQFDKREQDKVIEQFKREARIASRLRHPGICPIYDIGCINGIHYLTMAFIEGTELADVLADGRPVPVVRAVELTLRVAEALHALHQAGIVHRDLKPNNIRLQTDGLPVLLDFGLARLVSVDGKELATKSASAGTPSYMAPEQWHGKAEQIKPWTDVYALGVILFELLTGRRPFPGPSFVELFGQATAGPRPRPSEFVTNIPPALDQLCAEVLAINPAQRPADMLQLIARLQRCRGQLPPSGPLPTARSKPSSLSQTERDNEGLARVEPVIDLPLTETVPTGHLQRSRRTQSPQRPRNKAVLIALTVLTVIVVGVFGAWFLWPQGSAVTTSQAQPEPAFTNSIGMQFVLIKPGTFQMGSSMMEREKVAQHYDSAGVNATAYKPGLDAEQPQHEVEITELFYLGVYEVTQAEYEKVVKKNPSAFRQGGQQETNVAGRDTSRFPVESVSWDEAVAFIDTLNNLPEEKRKQRLYRLPTEAEWEYACRGGRSYQAFHYGDKSTHAEAVFAWTYPYESNDKQTAPSSPVAVDDPKYRPNAFGLYHMHGNIAEWCSDYYEANYYTQQIRLNPRGPKSPPGAQTRVIRGGSWSNYGWFCRSAGRYGVPTATADYNIGFRVVCVPTR